MIIKNHFRDILTIFGLSIALTIFITRPGFSQDTTKMKGDKKVKIIAKIVEDKNGKRQEFDTTINLDRRLKPGEMKDMMKDFEMRFKDLGDQMKDLQVEMNEMMIPDSGMMDSVQRLTEKAFRLRGGLGNMHFRHNFSPRAFNYDYHFDFPEVPEPPQPMIEEFNEEITPRMFKDKGESLNDLLGDIPMDRVKSYSIKDTKDGKRIIIELNKEPFLEHHRKVIIIRSPRPEGRPGQGTRHQIRKRVIIKEQTPEKEEEPDKL
ncbi:MAG: hypothetical protein ABSE72_07040 [Bacteroidales bacterium]|jgi:hypothetical protein